MGVFGRGRPGWGVIGRGVGCIGVAGGGGGAVSVFGDFGLVVGGGRYRCLVDSLLNPPANV